MSMLRACWVVHGPVGVGGDIEDVHVAGLDRQREQHVDPAQGRGVDVEELDGQRSGRLGAQEVPPAQVAAAPRCGRDSGLFQDPADG
jgi:hypothetical protein